LNLTFRTLASILKYDKQIPKTKSGRIDAKNADKPAKGYYADDSDVVSAIREKVIGAKSVGEFRTIECSIMDIADDIAYSTYDLEDAFKGRFLSPIFILSLPDELKAKIINKVQESLNKTYYSEYSITMDDYNDTIRNLFSGIIDVDVTNGEYSLSEYNAAIVAVSGGISDGICDNGYYRTEFTSELVGRFIRSVDVELNEKYPCLSQAKLSTDAFLAVEILKSLAFDSVIMSSPLKSSEHRGRWIVRRIFGELVSDGGHLLMPADWRSLIDAKPDDNSWKYRTICDYIAGMTDRYCVEYYERILGLMAPSIQKRF
jgi:dGTPase